VSTFLQRAAQDAVQRIGECGEFSPDGGRLCRLRMGHEGAHRGAGASSGQVDAKSIVDSLRTECGTLNPYLEKMAQEAVERIIAGTNGLPYEPEGPLTVCPCCLGQVDKTDISDHRWSCHTCWVRFEKEDKRVDLSGDRPAITRAGRAWFWERGKKQRDYACPFGPEVGRAMRENAAMQPGLPPTVPHGVTVIPGMQDGVPGNFYRAGDGESHFVPAGHLATPEYRFDDDDDSGSEIESERDFDWRKLAEHLFETDPEVKAYVAKVSEAGEADAPFQERFNEFMRRAWDLGKELMPLGPTRAVPKYPRENAWRRAAEDRAAEMLSYPSAFDEEDD
jgi:hypothetical protein